MGVKMKVNGEEIKVTSSLNLITFLELQGYDIRHIVVERNGDIVPKATYDSVILSQEDVLEVLRFVGGG